MMIGIDRVGLYTPPFFLPLDTLAQARGVDPMKYRLGLGQYQMAVPSPDEDIVTMAAAAVADLGLSDLSDIDWLLFATESGIDQSKAAGLYVHRLLNLPSTCRVVELKQACYAGTAGLHLALHYLKSHPTRKILLVASDIARYGLNTPGESSQGAAAVALLLSAQPSILHIEENSFVSTTQEVMDFWRPNGCADAFVDGHFSCMVYLSMLDKVLQKDVDTICYHTPLPKLVEKAHRVGPKAWLEHSLTYARQIGNAYTASLYLSWLSLLDHTPESMTGRRIGFYSYGSGAVAEFFTGVMQAGYTRRSRMPQRTELSMETYESWYQHALVDGQRLPDYSGNRFGFAGVAGHKRQYEVR